jgi:hypothetical protein
LACRHDRAGVGFSHAGRSLGWHASLVGDDGRILPSFPWYDHVDVALGRVSRWSFAPWRAVSADRPPTDVGDDGWDDLEQGWWGFVIPDGVDLYVGEADFDAITGRRRATRQGLRIQKAKSVSSGSRSPRSAARSTSTQRIPRASARVAACGLIACAASTPRQSALAGSIRIRSR